MEIIKKTSTHNTSAYKNRPIQYIVLHYTAGTSSKKGVARNIANMFASPTSRAASADFIVDDAEIVQYNGDIRNRYCYSVGDKKYGVKYNSQAASLYGIARNYNSVSIEMASSKVNKKTLNATDTDWYLTDAVVNNAVELTKYLMKTYNVPIDRVVMHNTISGKPCPQPWTLNESKLSGWYAFKKRLTGASSVTDSSSSGETKVDYYAMVTDATGLNCRSGIGTGFSVVKTFPANTTIHIVKESYGWGYTTDGPGWVNLSYTRKSTVKEDEIDMTTDQFLSEVFTKMTDEQAYKLYTKAMAHASKLDTPNWAKETWDSATKAGIVDGTAAERPAKRDEMVTVMKRLGLF